MTQEALPSTMKAAQVVEFNAPYQIRTVPVPKPGPSEYLVKIHAAGYCHTDAMVLEGASPAGSVSLPITGSHEPAGVIVAMGEKAAQEGKHKIGDRVGATCQTGQCLECYDCKEKARKYCRNSKGAIGISRDGAFAEYCLVDSHSTAIIPDKMSFEQAAPLACAGTTIFRAIKTAGLQPGHLIGIIGLGALGLLGIQMAKAMGYKVVGVDSRTEPVELAKSLPIKADLIIQSTISPKEALQEIAKLEPNKKWPGLDAVVLATDAPPSFQYAVDLLANHGKFVLAGQPEKGVTFQYFDLIFRNIVVVGTLLGDAQDLQDCFDLCAKHNIESSLTVYKLDDINQAVEAAHHPNRKGKAVVKFL